MPSFSGATWEIEAIVIDGLQQAFKGSERGAPHGVLQVVTSAIVSAILLVEADVRAIVDASMGRAARQVSYHIQETRRHQVIVAVGCKIVWKEWASCKMLTIFKKVSYQKKKNKTSLFSVVLLLFCKET